jgi:glycosyltransferase involved in cell wall biosynthesis
VKRLAIISTHPIQYNAPLFRLLAGRKKIGLKVFYTWSQSQDGNIFDPGFGIEKKWDIPLLEGYDHCFVPNVAARPGSHHFNGIRNPSLTETVSAYEPDAILVYGWSFHSHLKAIRHFKGKVPVYFRGDSTLIDESPGWSIKKILRRNFLKWVYRHIDYAFYAGAHNKAYFLKHGVSPGRLIFLPHAIDNNRFSGGSERAQQFRQLSGVPEEAICVLFAGKLEQKKDPSILLENFSDQDTVNAFLVFVGNGVMEDALKKKAAAKSSVRFLGFCNQADMPAVYAMADLFVLPSIGPSETWGLAVNEAMAASKAILVSDKCGCAPDLVIPGINGNIFSAGDKTDLKNKLAELLSDKHRLGKMGEKSYSIIRDWSFEKCASIIENELAN